MRYTRLEWRDGQPYSERFDDIYCSSHTDTGSSAGEGEFLHVFFEGNRLSQRWAEGGASTICELGFGGGLNCLLTIRHWLEHNRQHDGAALNYIAIERYPLSPDDIRVIASDYPALAELSGELTACYPPAVRGCHVRELFDGKVRLLFIFDDAEAALSRRPFEVDAWYLDGFSPSKNSAMWSPALLELVAGNSHHAATFATYTAPGEVRRNLRAAGFDVEKVKGFGNKREMMRGELRRRPAAVYRYADRPWSRPPPAGSSSDGDVTVIGAGIAGLCVADALCRRGRRVTLIDRESAIARSTSSNPAAIVYPRLAVDDPVANAFFLSAFCLAVHQLQQLQRCYPGDDLFWSGCGLLQAMDPARARKITGLELFGHDFFEITEFYDESFVYMKHAGYVVPSLLAKALYERNVKRLCFRQADVTRIADEGDEWACVAGEERVAASPTLVMATNHELLSPGSDSLQYLPIDLVAGSSVSVAAAELSAQKLRHVVNASCYMTPAHDGYHHVGATYCRPGEDRPATDGSDVDQLLACFSAMMGGDQPCDIGSLWSGVRGVARDRLPVIGACPDSVFFHAAYADIARGDGRKEYPAARYLDGLYLSLAHGSRGFTSSFLAAEIIAAQICGEPLPVTIDVLEKLSASRFILDQLKHR